MEPKSLRGGIDVGSTTVKVVIMDENNDSVYQTYQRHFSDVKKPVKSFARGSRSDWFGYADFIYDYRFRRHGLG